MNENKLRLCRVKGEIGYFHTWEHYMDVIGQSPMVGGHPGGQISYAHAIVEFPEGVVTRVNIKDIQFIDEINAELQAIRSCDMLEAIPDRKMMDKMRTKWE